MAVLISLANAASQPGNNDRNITIGVEIQNKRFQGRTRHIPSAGGVTKVAARMIARRLGIEREPRVTANGPENDLTDAFSREAVSFIKKHKARPFFLYVPYSAPHTPLQTTLKYYDRFPHMKEEPRRIYASMVSAMDDGIGDILDALKESGIEENTIVIFLSDNGCALWLRACSNDPLRLGDSSGPI